jgi:hypothetical protein
VAAKGSASAARVEAEEIGLAALVFMTEDADRLGHFLNDTGFSPDELSRAAGSPETLAAVLDYLLNDESMLMVFSAGANLDPSEIAPARALLPGGMGEAYSNQATASSNRPRKPSRRWAGPDAQ